MVGSARKKDGRREVGATVRVKAIAVTSPSECKRRYGTLWKSQTVTGVVQRVVTPPPGTGKHVSIVAEWFFGDSSKVKEVKLGNVTLVTAVNNNTGVSQGENSLSSRLPPAQSAAVNPQVSSRPQGNASLERTAVNRDDVTTRAVFVTSHGVEWTAKDIRLPLNGFVPRRHWSVSQFTGQEIGENQ